MKLTVKTLQGVAFSLDAELTDAVSAVKQKIEGLQSFPAAQQKLIHAGKVLKDDSTLAEYNVKENREDPPVPTDEFDVRSSSPGHRSRPVPLKPRTQQSDEDSGKEGDVDDANAVGLLLDFFYKANRNEKKGGKKPSSSAAAASSSSSSSSSIKDDNSSTSNDEKKESVDEQVPADADEQIKKEPTETSAPTSPSSITATPSENDTSINSPTKRMRALSVSGYVDPAAAKRSRIGSFSTVTAA
ncbi:hypothetical protein ON010_g1373 [Phytophthora cinnamomi]|nr:hypothetical protein ON010_g1373 [Phytophthora cinnamomi]